MLRLPRCYLIIPRYRLHAKNTTRFKTMLADNTTLST